MVEQDAAHERQWKADRDLARRVDEEGEGLTEWEVDFVEQCVAVVENRLLTPKMREKLEEIEEERCS